jgi:hypothetical protein
MKKTDMMKLGPVEVVAGVSAKECSGVTHLEEDVRPVSPVATVFCFLSHHLFPCIAAISVC